MPAGLTRLPEGIAAGDSRDRIATTSVIVTIGVHAGLDPTVDTGGKLHARGSNPRLGSGLPATPTTS